MSFETGIAARPKPAIAAKRPYSGRWPTAWLLIALTGIAHFLHLPGFGLYEDDDHYIAEYLDADLAMIGELALRAVIEWPQGRPLQSIVPPLVATLLYPHGGLPALYLVAFAVTAFSVLLFHRLALRVTAAPPVALIAAVMFCLYPADTTHPFLMHALVLRLALRPRLLYDLLIDPSALHLPPQ